MSSKHLKYTLVFTCSIALLGVAYAWRFFSDASMATSDEPAKATPPSAPPHPADTGPESSSTLAYLEALGYVDATYDPEADLEGVLHYDEGKCLDGYNFYNSRTSNEAFLIDMSGNVIHRWSYPTGRWQHAELLPNGDIIVIVKDKQLFRIDRDSELLWTRKLRVHHDLWIDGDRLFALTRGELYRPDYHRDQNLLEDTITVLSLDGTQLEVRSVFELFANSSVYRKLLPDVADISFDRSDEAVDLLHTNHIEIFDGSLEHLSPLFRKGNALLSSRNIDAVYIVDMASNEIRWLWGPGHLKLQHHPTLLGNGNILIFNNGLARSQVLEIDPLAGEIVWKYEADDFFSKRRGSAQRLSNGNTLITESDKGYVFEVTREGEIVWKFANPDVNESKERSAIWRMTRFPPESLAFTQQGADDREHEVDLYVDEKTTPRSAVTSSHQ